MAADEAILRDAFKAIDADGSGSVDTAELKEVVKVYLELMNEKIDHQKVNDLAEVSVKMLIVQL